MVTTAMKARPFDAGGLLSADMQEPQFRLSPQVG
jgi:hypothetical protein